MIFLERENRIDFVHELEWGYKQKESDGTKKGESTVINNWY